MTEKPRVIGGLFGLPPLPNPQATRPWFRGRHDVLLANARCALWLLVERLRPDRVWLPSYLCDSVVEAIDRRIAGVNFYEVGYDLAVNHEQILDAVGKTDLVVMVDYFGFPPAPSGLSSIRRKGAVVVEDASQALLSSRVGEFSDYALYSPRKFLGVPDGGILKPCSGPPITDADLSQVPARWWLDALAASLHRQEFDRHGGDRGWFPLFQQIESAQPRGRYAMSQLSMILLDQAFDYRTIARQRRHNYATLLRRLAGVAVYPELPDQVVPLGFPIRTDRRDALRSALFREDIYPPVHWPVPECVPAQFSDSRRLSQEIMTLPCDQRYCELDMDRMARLVEEMI